VTGLELDQRFYNIVLKILEPEPRVFLNLEPGPDVLLKTKNKPKHKITNQGCYICK